MAGYIGTKAVALSTTTGNILGDMTVGGTTDVATLEFNSLSGTGSVTITDILDEDNLASNSATKLATQQSIKAYVDAQVDTVDTLAEILAIGNRTSGTGKIEFRDAAIFINSSADGQLDLVADTEIQIAATTIDINGAVALNGAITGATNITLSGKLDAATLDTSGAAVIDTTLAVGAALASGFTASVTGSVPFRAASNSTVSSGTYGGVSVSRDKAGANQGTGISFHMDDDAGNITEYAYLGTVIEDDSNGAEDGSLGLFVTEGSAARARVPLKVQSSGRIVISNDLPIWSGSFGGALFLKGNNASAARHFRASIVDSNGAQSGNFHLTLGNNGDVTIGDGNLIIGTNGHGIDFSADTTDNTNLTGELLDDYEEGTFQMTLGQKSGNIFGLGRYIKIGHLVHFQWYTGGAITADEGAGNATFTGLPFTSDNSDSYPTFSAHHNTYCPTSSGGYILSNSTSARFTANGATSIAAVATASNRYVMVSGTYRSTA